MKRQYKVFISGNELLAVHSVMVTVTARTTPQLTTSVISRKLIKSLNIGPMWYILLLTEELVRL